MIEIEKPRIECVESPATLLWKILSNPWSAAMARLGQSLRRILLSSLPGTAAPASRSPVCSMSFQRSPV